MKRSTSSTQKKPSVAIDRQAKGLYRVKGGFFAPAAPAAVWKVLTDYERLSKIVSSLAESRVVGRQGGSVYVRQTAQIQLLAFKKSLQVVLRVLEQPKEHKILFEDTLKKDFKQYDGCWRILPLPDGCRVHYELLAQSTVEPPAALARVVMQAAAKKLLAALQKEMAKKD